MELTLSRLYMTVVSYISTSIDVEMNEVTSMADYEQINIAIGKYKISLFDCDRSKNIREERSLMFSTPASANTPPQRSSECRFLKSDETLIHNSEFGKEETLKLEHR
ncbi:hypothetical protein A4A49_52789 [Nicotiana attenuata]|uniref:Uncharacterized protein n=1 Tax=Nicotiana attenuata TaxID=49451 RepID=A0A1J6JMQ7_NICAT|nr:hypothetical protein A4A49_52789 [Nicotiana attenuata]